MGSSFVISSGSLSRRLGLISASRHQLLAASSLDLRVGALDVELLAIETFVCGFRPLLVVVLYKDY